MHVYQSGSPSIGIESTSHQSKVRFLLADRTARHHFKRNFLINFVGHEDIVLGQTSRYSLSSPHASSSFIVFCYSRAINIFGRILVGVYQKIADSSFSNSNGKLNLD